jgi:signal transduction histidine kinase
MLWLATLQEVVDRAAHEVKDALNGVALNLEVVRSRAMARVGSDADPPEVAPFTEAAAEQLEVLGRRVEALLFLSRPARSPADVSLTLRHLAELLQPAARSDGGSLAISGLQRPAPSRADGTAVRLALAGALLAAMGKGRVARCSVEAGVETVVRFSHESADAIQLDPATSAVLAGQSIVCRGSGPELTLVFPGYA